MHILLAWACWHEPVGMSMYRQQEVMHILLAWACKDRSQLVQSWKASAWHCGVWMFCGIVWVSSSDNCWLHAQYHTTRQINAWQKLWRYHNRKTLMSRKAKEFSLAFEFAVRGAGIHIPLDHKSILCTKNRGNRNSAWSLSSLYKRHKYSYTLRPQIDFMH